MCLQPCSRFDLASKNSSTGSGGGAAPRWVPKAGHGIAAARADLAAPRPREGDGVAPTPSACRQDGEQGEGRAARPSRRAHQETLDAAPSGIVSGLDLSRLNSSRSGGSLRKVAAEPAAAGAHVFSDLEGALPSPLDASDGEEGEEGSRCPHSIVLTGDDFRGDGPGCGAAVRAHARVLHHGRRHAARRASQTMELQGLKTVDGEDPPRILHLNPRLCGDWSGKPAIEQNTCYRMQWGTPIRCEGWMSRADEETVDGMAKCEKWIQDEDSKESNTSWWLNRLIGRTTKVSVDWPYPFVEDRMFVLTLTARLEGYHVNVDGRHVTSFPYRIGFVLEDATGLSLNGDLDVQSVFTRTLPTTHPSFAPQKHLDMSPIWQAPPLPDEPVEVFVGILTAGNHFAERMVVRKTWMSAAHKSSNVVDRFFVALHGRNEVNMELKKEAEFFGDIVSGLADLVVIVPACCRGFPPRLPVSLPSAVRAESSRCQASVRNHMEQLQAIKGSAIGCFFSWLC